MYPAIQSCRLAAHHNYSLFTIHFSFFIIFTLRLAVEEDAGIILAHGNPSGLHQFKDREEGRDQFAAVAGGKEVVILRLTGLV